MQNFLEKGVSLGCREAANRKFTELHAWCANWKSNMVELSAQETTKRELFFLVKPDEHFTYDLHEMS